MNFAFSEEQEMLRDSARRWLEDKAPSERVRELMETEDGYDPNLWSGIAEMGWQAMHIPEEYGGAGFTQLELMILLEEMGRALFPSPFLSSVVLGANALLLGGSEEQKQAYLPGIAAGELIATVAAVEPGGDWEEASIQLSAKRDGDDWVLNGTKRYVVDGATAGLVVTAARTDEGVTLFLVPTDSAGFSATHLQTMDQTRKQAELEYDDVRVPADGRLGEAGGGWTILEKLYDLAAVALAAEDVGGAQKCLEMAVDYAKVRVQFGRPIGSFQAIKHKCADMLVQVESAKSAAYYAAWAAAEDPQELLVVAPLAKSYCSEAYFWVAAENIQVHGGIGFTWEHDMHLYFKRVRSGMAAYGDASENRELVARSLSL